mmetsp:Transcript_102666/g.203821  ORF Transcript_102666/g.203821 Transcript_102666/m.203821 type:complete len:85 (-) Transcript_102666:1-255(-)
MPAKPDLQLKWQQEAGWSHARHRDRATHTAKMIPRQGIVEANLADHVRHRSWQCWSRQVLAWGRLRQTSIRAGMVPEILFKSVP